MSTSPANAPDLTGPGSQQEAVGAGSTPQPGSAARNAAGRAPGAFGIWAVRAGMVAPIVFYAVMIVLGQLTPGYDALSRFGSELSLGRLGPIMIANFILLGICEIAFAVWLRQVIGPQRSGRLGAAMVGVAGVAFVVAGVFVTDPQGTVPPTTHGILHVVAALLLFPLAMPTAGLAMARRFRHHQRGFAFYSAITAVATPVLFIATFLSGDMLGLMERILIGVDLLWLAVLARQASRFRPVSDPEAGARR